MVLKKEFNMNQVNISRQVVRESFSLVWRNKRLLWYFFFIVGLTLSLLPLVRYLASLLVRIPLFKAVTFWNVFSISQATSIFVAYIIAGIFYAALFNRIYRLFANKKITFIESFSFAKGLIGKIILWAFIMTLAAFAQTIFIERGVGITYDPTVGVRFTIKYMTFSLWLIGWIIPFVWFLFSYYILPMLVKKNKGFWQTVKEAFQLGWEYIWVTILSWFMVFSWVCLLVVAVVIPVIIIEVVIGIPKMAVLFSLMWLVGLLFSDPLAATGYWIIVVLAGVPLLSLGLYVMTVFNVLPAVIYNKLMKLR